MGDDRAGDDRGPNEGAGEPPAGRRIVAASWAGDCCFAVTAVPAALGVDSLHGAALATALVLFVVSIGVWAWGFGTAIVRSAQGDEIVVGNLFLVQGDSPRRVRLHLFASLAMCVLIAAVTAATEPFGVLVPMLPLALIGLWGARHGRFPPRRDTQR